MEGRKNQKIHFLLGREYNSHTAWPTYQRWHMKHRKREGGLTNEEMAIVKALLAQGWRNQDIQALLNTGRKATVNSARITGVKQDNKIAPADNDTVNYFLLRKKSYDPKTGLNSIDDERLIRAREAMTLAVQIFNSPNMNFKTEIFAILVNVAWTYLLHEFYDKKEPKVGILGKDGRSLLLSQMLKREDCPLTDSMKANLKALINIRDEVEHKLLGKSDLKWPMLFQACCLNFDKILCTIFGEAVSLQNELGFAIQFARLNMEQIATIQKYEIPEYIEALDARLKDGLTEEKMDDQEYQLRIDYILSSASKNRSQIQFINQGSEDGREPHNVIVKHKLADELYPHRASRVAALVSDRSGKRFTSHNHTLAWKKFGARPRPGAAKPNETKKDYCIFHAAHNDYTYSEKWVDFLVDKIGSDEGYASICSFETHR